VSPAEFEGATATEVHEFYNAAGIKTGHAVVTRESMWDEMSRARALRLQEHEDSVNRFGLSRAEAHKAQPFKVEKSTDYSERAVAAAERADRVKAEKANNGKLPDGYGDGVHYYPILPDPSELREDPRGH
jgi:hypothetical protein